MSASDDLAKMLAEGRSNTQLMNTSSAESYMNGMNQYMQGIYDEYNARGVTPEEPNGWSQMLMNLASQNNSWNAEQAQKQMDFQERMSNTAHQREIADLKAAGLNPVLSAKLGGASTPSGASATADTAIVGSIVQLMDKMLDVEQSNAQMAFTRELKSGSGSGSGSSGLQSLIEFALGFIPGVNSAQARAGAKAAVDNGVVWRIGEAASKYAYNPKYRSKETHGLSSRIFGNG